jgi:butyrate kinase
MCFVQKLTQKDMQRITDQGGLLSYFKVDSIIELEKRIDAGDKDAEFMYRVMAYQVSKSIGEMFTVLCSEADAIVLTGGIAYSERFTGWIRERVGKLAPVLVIPGEREMLAMARGGMRVLNREEEVKHITDVPKGFANMDEFIAHFKEVRPDLLDKPRVQRMLQL